MKNGLKRALAWLLMLAMLLFFSVSLAAEAEMITDAATYGSVVSEPVIPGLLDGGALLGSLAATGEADGHRLVLMDVSADGEIEETIELSAAEGMTLAQALAASSCRMSDGTAVEDCIWYTMDEAGMRSPADMDAAVAGELTLYTYSYSLKLRISEADAEEAIATMSLVEVVQTPDGVLHLSITAREGEQLKTTDFVQNGVDYSLYNWMDASGNAINIQQLIANGLNGNITATSNGQLKDNLQTKEGTISFYVCIEGKWTLIANKYMTAYTYNDRNRYALTSAQMESIYGRYGLTGLTAGTNLLWHCEANQGRIYGNANAFEHVGVVYSPILEKAKDKVDCEVYYMPAGYNNQTNATKQEAATKNSLYRITVLDPSQKVYAPDELPEVRYALVGSNPTITVKTKEGVNWLCKTPDGESLEGVDNGNGTISFTINNIQESYNIYPSAEGSETLIYYDINLPETPADEEYDTPTIKGGSSYGMAETGDTHTLLSPSLTSYHYASGKYLGQASFDGWIVNDDPTNIVHAGEELDLTEYKGSVVHLTAKWSTEMSKASSSLVNFYVAIKAVSDGSTDWIGSIDVQNFSNSVYSTDTGITGEVAIAQKLYREPKDSQYYVLGDTSGDALDVMSGQLRTQLTNGYTITKIDGSQYTYQIDFPSDETVLRNMRRLVRNGQKITLNGKQLTYEELTTENYTICWYVFKLAQNDGWHVDGILVAKSGKLKVQKTFAGNSEAIEAVKNNYSISVTGEQGCVHPGGTLQLNDDDVEVSSDGATYTWTLEVDQRMDYTVKENNYVYNDQNLYTTNALYRVSNSKLASQNTTGWVDYSGGTVEVTGQSSNESDSKLQTVAFVNTYTAPGTLIIRKLDANTGNLMPNVSFTVTKDDDSSFALRDLGNGYYSADPNSEGDIASSITTNSVGQAYLWVGGGSYSITEDVPTGYDDPGAIQVVLEGDEENEYKVVNITSATAANGNKFVSGDGLTLTITNHSRSVEVRLEKIWEDKENKTVKLQLYNNGYSLGDDYCVTLDGRIDNVENAPWKCRFTGLPLYADGAPARYTLREVQLGEFAYSEAIPEDGYQYYDVSYSDMRYVDAAGNPADINTAAAIELSVSNQRSTGNLSIKKLGENGEALAGAVFYLYAAGDSETLPELIKNADGTLELKDMDPKVVVTSNASGMVNFGNVDAGMYYLIEHSAPAGHDGSQFLYRLNYTVAGYTMEVLDGDTWQPILDKSVANMRKRVDVTILKQVSGGLGERDREFQFTVRCNEKMDPDTGYTLNAEGNEASFTLRHGKSVTLKGIPVGSQLTISETGADDYEQSMLVNGVNQLTSYVVSVQEGENNITYINNNPAVPDTGIVLDSQPYGLVLLAVLAAGSLACLRRCRRYRRQQ